MNRSSHIPAAPLTRRDWLRGIAGAGALLGGAAHGGQAHRPKSSAASTAPSDRSDVAVMKGRDLRELTRRAVDAIGGIATVVKPHDRVLIKPNLLDGFGQDRYDFGSTHQGTPKQFGMISDPQVVCAVAELCLEAGASQVLVTESVAYGARGLHGVDGRTLQEGVQALNQRYGVSDRVRFEDLEPPLLPGNRQPDPAGLLRIKSPGTDLDEIVLCRKIASADKVISVPVLKSHHDCCVTLGIKNFMGATSYNHYTHATPGKHRAALHECRPGVDQAILDMVKFVHPDLTVIDGSIGMEGEGVYIFRGPKGPGIPVDFRARCGGYYVVASRDPVAADATATRLIGFDPRRIKMLMLARRQGMGRLHESDIRLHCSEKRLENLRFRTPACYPNFG